MMSIQWNEDGLNELFGGLQKQFDEASANNPIPEGSSVDEIEAILLKQLEESGVTPDPAAVREQAEEIHAGWPEKE